MIIMTEVVLVLVLVMGCDEEESLTNMIILCSTIMGCSMPCPLVSLGLSWLRLVDPPHLSLFYSFEFQKGTNEFCQNRGNLFQLGIVKFLKCIQLITTPDIMLFLIILLYIQVLNFLGIITKWSLGLAWLDLFHYESGRLSLANEHFPIAGLTEWKLFWFWVFHFTGIIY